MGLNDEEDLGWGIKGYICGMESEGILLGNKLNIYKTGRELDNLFGNFEEHCIKMNYY